MKMIGLSVLVFISFISFSQDSTRVNTLCGNYYDWFANDTIDWDYEDSLASYNYNNKLFDLYQPIKEFYFNGISPYNHIYEIYHYDTALLFSILKLCAESKEKYDEQIGIPISVAHGLIKNDAMIIGTVVDRINKYTECRFYSTTYFIRTDSVIFSYFPISVGDSVLSQESVIGYTGYCDTNQFRTYTVNACGYNIKVGDEGYFILDRSGYVRHFQYQNSNPSTIDYKDPFCFNSFKCRFKNEESEKMFRSVNKEKLMEFTRRIKIKTY
ncbi:MAG: hypothetical protein K8S16_10445 [Bacteroidales bacterium]|nr:hypothetical protein [Bacteroidales bacterium]